MNTMTATVETSAPVIAAPRVNSARMLDDTVPYSVQCGRHPSIEREHRVPVGVPRGWRPKYRRKVIGGRMEIVSEVVAEHGAWLVELETMPDRVHLLVEVDPQYGVSPPGESDQRPVVSAVASRVSLAEVKASDVVDQLVFCCPCWWCPAAGRAPLRRTAETTVSSC